MPFTLRRFMPAKTDMAIAAATARPSRTPRRRRLLGLDSGVILKPRFAGPYSQAPRPAPQIRDIQVDGIRGCRVLSGGLQKRKVANATTFRDCKVAARTETPDPTSFVREPYSTDSPYAGNLA